MEDVVPNLMNDWDLSLCLAFVETHHGASFVVNDETRNCVSIRIPFIIANW